MSVIGTDNVAQNSLVKKSLRRKISPEPFLYIAILNSSEQSVLIGRTQFAKAIAVTRLGFRVNRRKTTAPGLAHWWQFGIAIPIAGSSIKFLVDHCGERNGTRPCH